jgi:hypothetical protein
METRQEYIITMIEKHIAVGCSGADCKLNDRMIRTEGTVKNIKTAFATVLAIITSVTLREHWLPVMAKIRDVF